MKKFIVLEVDLPDQDYDDDGNPVDYGDIDVQTKVVPLNDAVKDPQFVTELQNRGWYNKLVGLGKLSQDDTFGPRCFVLNRTHYGRSSYPSYISGTIIDETNIANVTQMMRGGIGYESLFAVEISADLMLKVCPEYQKLIKQVEANAKLAKKTAEAKKKRKEQQKAKREARKLENAKKLLAAKGIKVGDDT